MRRATLVALTLILVQPAVGTEGGDVVGTACRVTALDTAGFCAEWKSDVLPAPVGRAEAVLAAPDGLRVFAAGTGIGPNGASTGVVAAYRASDGFLLWNRSHAPAVGATDRALVLAPDVATLYVLGAEGSGLGSLMNLAALDPETGAERWFRELPRGGFFAGLAVAPDGSHVYAPTRQDGGPAVAAVASGGTVDWTRTLPVSASATPVELMAARDGGGVYVTTGTPAARVTALSATDGAVLWSVGPLTALHSPSLDESALSPDGSRLFVAGFGSGLEAGDNWDYRIVALDTADGAIAWEARYDDPLVPGSLEAAWALAVSPDGTAVHVTGLGTGPAGDDDYLTVSLDAATGALRWVARFNAGPSTFDDVNAGIAASPDGARVYVGGTSSLHAAQMTIAAYDAQTGAEAWRLGYLAERDPVFGYGANDLAVAPDSGTLYVAADANRAFFVAAYDRDLGSLV